MVNKIGNTVLQGQVALMSILLKMDCKRLVAFCINHAPFSSVKAFSGAVES